MNRLSKKNFYRNVKKEQYQKLYEAFYQSDVETGTPKSSGPFRDSGIQFEPVAEVEESTRKAADLQYIGNLAAELKGILDEVVEKVALVPEFKCSTWERENPEESFIFDQHFVVKNLLDAIQNLGSTLDSLEEEIAYHEGLDQTLKCVDQEIDDAVAGAVEDWNDAVEVEVVQGPQEVQGGLDIDDVTKANGAVNAYDNMFLAPQKVSRLVHGEPDEGDIIGDILRNR